jgi:hypothetical protein
MLQPEGGYLKSQFNLKYEAQTALFKDPVRTAQ